MGLIYIITKAVCTISGLLYPAYASYKALEERRSEELLTWLMFWIVMGIFTAVEFVADVIIFWFPFYYQLKMGFILWLILPQTKGSTYLYKTFIHPTLIRHETEIDQMLEKVQTEVKKTSVEMGKRSVEVLQKAAIESLTKGQFLLMDRLAQQNQPTDVSTSAHLEEISNDEQDPRTNIAASEETVQRKVQTRVRHRNTNNNNDIVVVDENLSYSDRDVDDLMGFDSDSDASSTQKKSEVL
ncbi:hypothetical protein K7432_009391 [Basidiobolus ranarum]|uniref:Protein YOP1 n=1 Tax=Basidiobolus ranarum TaxID=34480 RepID=A0ABR2VXW5_9FUNG